MLIVLSVFIGVFLLVISGAALVSYWREIQVRLSIVVSARPKSSSGGFKQFFVKPSRESVQTLAEPLQRLVPKSENELSVSRKRLMLAGYRSESAIQIFYAAKVLTPALACVFNTVTGIYEFSPFIVYVLSLGLGFIAPDYWLIRRIKSRQVNIQLGLPDALDLLVICMEAGLGLDQAVLRVAEELRTSQPEISDELTMVNVEHRAGYSRADAWKRLGERTDVECVRTLITFLIQADQFGSSISTGLRTQSETLRTRRRQEAEEQAAKTTVKLVFPLVLFIFPSLFVVLLGPAVISIQEGFRALAR